jgi:hypothetical protein
MHIHSSQVAVNNGGMYWACLRLTPAVPPTGKYCALFQILRQVLFAVAHAYANKLLLHLHVEVCVDLICGPRQVYTYTLM